jgi:predicted phage terminase large subunit-like protein
MHCVSFSIPFDPKQLSPQEAARVRDQILRFLAPSDVYAYGEYVFGYEAENHHRRMIEFINDHVHRRKNCVILMPRGSAKTTWGNTIWLSHYISTHPDARIGLVSNTAKQSNDFSRAIRHVLEANAQQHELFGNLKSSAKWTDVEWLRADSRWMGSKDVTLYSGGAGSAIISKRFDLIICDDILDEENTATPEAREKVNTWFWKTLRPCLVPGGVIVIFGTRWAEDDLYQQLTDDPEKGGRGWDQLVIKAIEKDEDGREYSYWPSYWPLDKLQEERSAMGTALFSCAYQNDISGLMAGNIFAKRNFDYFKTLPDASYTIRMGVDLASSERETADYTARVITAEDNDTGDLYVLSVYRDRREAGHAEFIFDGWLAYPGMALVICENQMFQSTLVQTVMRDYPRIPIEGRKSDADKVTRARAVAAKYEAHKVHHHQSLEDTDFERELLSFPKGHDDFVDALGFSFDLAGQGFFFGSVRRH